MRWLWRAKWNLLRLMVAAFLLWVCAVDTGARLARVQLAALPSFDYAQEVEALRVQGRYGEAVVIADAGLADAELAPDARAAVERERAAAVQEQDGVIRKIKSAGLGALSGEGDSLEALVGAVTADLFIVGDVRDLVIQGGKQIIDGDSDGVILTLSVLGVFTTLAPEIDWVPSMLKAAAKGGHLSKPMGEWLKKTIKAKRTGEVTSLFTDLKVVANQASPGGAMRLLKHAEGPEDVARMARFLESTGPGGAAALHMTGKHGQDLLKAGVPGEALVKGARKGPAGVAFLRSPSARALLRPHPLLGVAKAVYKGNAEKLVRRAVERLDAAAWWVIPMLAGWCVVEIGLLFGKRAERASPAGA